MGSNRRSSFLSPAELSYLVAHGSQPDAVQSDLIAETARLGDRARMQTPPEQGALLTALARIAGARDAIEVGTFTGYSSLCIARGLADGGRLTCCDVSEEWTAVARRYWARAGVDSKIELRLGPALQTLRSFDASPQFDFAFVDAEKTEYVDYYEELLPRMRSGALILADNVLAGGRAADSADNSDYALAIRRFNSHVAADKRVASLMLPIGDGLYLIRKR